MTPRPFDASPALAWRWGEYEYQFAQRVLLHRGVQVAAEERVLDLLGVLLQHRDRALDRQEVITAIWGKRPVSDATLRQLVYKTRRVIGDDGEHQGTISTRYGRALQWVAPVEEVAQDNASPGKHVDLPDVRLPAADGGSDSERAPPESDRPAGPDRRASSVPSPADVHGIAEVVEVAPVRAPRASRRTTWILVALLLVSAAGWTWQLERTESAPGIPRDAATPAAAVSATHTTTLAVLPFVDVDGAQDPHYVGDGLAEELINRLARMPNLRVTARTSAFAFRGKAVDVREVGKQLGVATVLEGSVQRSGNDWRVRAALIDAATGFELWSGEYDASGKDLLGMEGRIADNVVKALYPKLEAAALQLPPVDHPVDPAARDAYYVGLEFIGRRTRPDLDQAVSHFQRAISIDPAYADAWGGLAMAYAVWNDYDSDDPPDLHYDDAMAAVKRAESLDPGSARAHAVLGLLQMKHWQWPQAAAEYRRALQLDPSDATAHQWYAMYLWYMGDYNSALAQMRLANQLDPLSPVIKLGLGRALLYTGHGDQAVLQFQQALALAPDFPLAHVMLAQGFLGQERNADALREVRTAVALAPKPTPSSYIAMLGVALHANGDAQAAGHQLALLQSRGRDHYASGASIAFLEAQLGASRDQIFQALFAAEAVHDPMLQPVVSYRRGVWYADARMAQLRASMGLPAH